MLGKYPSLSTDWLILGIGQMYREPQHNDLFSANEHNTSDKINQFSETRADNKMKPSDSRGIFLPPVAKERNSVSETGRTQRVICFFNDGTFKEYFAGDQELS
jgi:hypothetical protein